MATLIHAQVDDEIADLIAKVGATSDDTVGLVLPQGSQALQTPLNARLLRNFSRQKGRSVAIVSDEPRTQELARQQGISVYPSVVSFQRGLEIGSGSPAAFRSGTGTALQEAPPSLATVAPVAPPPGPPSPPQDPAAPVQPRRGPLAPAAGGTGSTGGAGRSRIVASALPPSRDRRRMLYFGGAAVALIGLVLFFTLAPTATVTITVAATPLSVSPTIQGSTDAAAAKQGDHILTAVVNATAQSQFTATPTGSATLPPTAAGATLVFTTDIPSPATEFTVSRGDEFQTSDKSITFVATQTTTVCISSGNTPPTTADCGGTPANSQVTVQDSTPEAKGNVAANTITVWPEDPCPSDPLCNGHNITVNNPQAASGGADSKQVTVASQTDVSGWTTQVSQLENQLTNQINAQLQQKAGGGTFAVDPGGNGKSLNCTVQPQLPAANDQFSTSQITVSCTGQAVEYNLADVRDDLTADLNNQVTQGDQLAPGKLNIQPCSVTQAGTDGTVVLSCSATDLEQPILDTQGLKQQLAGKNPGDAQRIISGAVDKVEDVNVSEFPFKLFYLPLFSSRIEVDENFVTQQPSSSP